MNLEQQAVKSVFWVGIARTASQFLSWSVTLILIRILSPEDYGLMGMVLAYKFFILIFFDMSIGEALLQKKNLSDADIYTAFWICPSFAAVLYAVTWFAAIAWADFFSAQELVPAVRVIGVSLLFLSIQEIPNRLMARDFEFKKRSLCQMVAGIVNILTSLILALRGFGVWSLIIGEVARDFTFMVLILAYKKWLPRFVFSFSSAGQMLKYGLPVTVHYLLDYFSSRMDVILIGRLMGQTILGYYSVALSLSRMPVDKGVFIIQGVVFPLFSKLQDNREEFVKYYYMIIYLISLFIFPVFLGMFAISEDIIVVILSSKWLPSLFAFRIFCFLGVLLSFKGILLVMLKARGNTRAVFMFSVYSAIFMPLSFWILSRFGLTGMALSWISVYPFLFSYLCYHVLKDIQASFLESVKRIRHALIASCLMVVVIGFIKWAVFQNHSTLMALIVHISTGIFIYTGYFYFFSRKTYSDIKRIWFSLRA